MSWLRVDDEMTKSVMARSAVIEAKRGH